MDDFDFGDIAWADGKAWWRQYDADSEYLLEAWESRDSVSPLSDLQRHADFTWLVLHGQRVDTTFPTPGYTGIPIEVHETEPVKYGRRKEREAIVEWLRRGPTEWAQCCECDRDTALAADLIERGSHLRGDDD